MLKKTKERLEKKAFLLMSKCSAIKDNSVFFLA